MPKADEKTSACTVYYDGGCPLCRAEIDLYQTQGSQAEFLDLTVDGPLPDGLDRAQALARFHVKTEDGELKSGAAAFSELWIRTPGWRWLGRIVARRPILDIAEVLYRVFLIIRPSIQWTARLFVQQGRRPSKS